MIERSARRLASAILPEKFKPRLRRAALKLQHWGWTHRCAFCNSHLRSFLPFGVRSPAIERYQIVGGGYRPQAVCPVCGSLDRERLLFLYLLHKTEIFRKPQRILHVAPEARLGDSLRHTHAGNYLSSDLNPANAMVKMDITSIDLPDNSFDVILCNHVLEHVTDDRRAMAELCRVLTPGGWAILQVPLSRNLLTTYEDPSIVSAEAREKAFGQVDHVRVYGADYVQRLEDAGFAVTVFQWKSEPETFKAAENRFGLLEDEGIYHATKRPAA